MKKYCLAVDLVDDAELIAEYMEWHKPGGVWPEITASIKDAGVTDMEIYRIGNRMFMIMETTDDFTFEKKAAMDAANPKVQEWENLMWKFQQSMPFAKNGEKWMLLDKIFSLQEQG